MKKVLAIVLALVLVFAMAACGSQEEASFPSEPVNCIVPYAAGGGTDLMVRAAAGNIDLGGETMVCTNIEGANSLTGAYECYNAEPDGYTLLSIALETIVAMNMSGTTPEALYEELTPIGSLVEDANILAVAADSPWQTYDEFVAYAKEAGKDCTIASTSKGGSNEFFTYGLAETSGYDFTYVPYDGGAKSRTAVLGGDNDAVVCQVSEIKALFDSGEMRVLGVSAEEQTDLLAGVPTFKEQGYDIVFGLHRSVWAPKGLDTEVQTYLSNAFETACALDSTQETFIGIGYTPIFTAGADLGALVPGLVADMEHWATLIK